MPELVFFFFFTLVTGPRRSLSLRLSDTRVYEPQIRAGLGTTAHFCKVVVLKLRAELVVYNYETETRNEMGAGALMNDGGQFHQSEYSS